MSKIVVSYRRSDSAATAGRIYDRLIDRFGEASVFMDVDKIPFGTDFRHHIQDVLSNCDVLLAVVGARWLGAAGDGATRIKDDADPVRVEIETALRQRVAVIPLLVDGAAMPAATDLPDDIRDFAYLNAAPVDSGRDFRTHMERVIRSVDEILTMKAKPAPAATKSAPKRRSRVATISIPIVLLIVAAIGFALVPEHLYRATPPAPKPAVPKAEPKATPRPTAQSDQAPPPAMPPPVAPPPGAPPAQPTYRVLANVSGGVQNLRSGPAVKYPIVVAIPAGATGITLGDCRKAEDNTRPWCAAKWRQYSGWISSCCIVDEKTGALPKVP